MTLSKKKKSSADNSPPSFNINVYNSNSEFPKSIISNEDMNNVFNKAMNFKQMSDKDKMSKNNNNDSKNSNMKESTAAPVKEKNIPKESKGKTKSKDKNTSKDNITSKDKVKNKSRDSVVSRDRTKTKSKDQSKDQSRDRIKDKVKSRDTIKERDKSKDKNKSKDGLKDRDLSKDKSKTKSKDINKEKEKEAKAKSKDNNNIGNSNKPDKDVQSIKCSDVFQEKNYLSKDKVKDRSSKSREKVSAIASREGKDKDRQSKVTLGSKDRNHSKDRIKCESEEKRTTNKRISSIDNMRKSKSKEKRHKSSIDRKSKSKSKSKKHRKSHKKKHKKHLSGNYSSEVSLNGLPESVSKLDVKVRKITACPGPRMILREDAINSNGYAIHRVKLSTSEYSQIFRAKKLAANGERSIELVVKIINLTECSPRFKVNLVKDSIRIMRFISTYNKELLSPLFIKIYEIFMIDSVKLYIFMEECSSRLLYDYVKSNDTIKADEARSWTKAIVMGIHHLQKIGVAHRYLKLQHILFDSSNNPKLCGWSKAVFYWDPEKKIILLQRQERRVRRNYYLPPEAFQCSYDPSKADIWSIGVILVSVVTKRYPFNVRDIHTKFSTQWREFVKKHQMNTFVRNLCNQIFIIDPKRRIKSAKILENIYFKVGIEKLLPLSCRGDPKGVMKESSRVGGVSAIDLRADGSSQAIDEQQKPSSKKTEEPQKVETKVEPSKTEKPKVEKPKTEKPKTEKPKQSEKPKSKSPKAEPPKVEPTPVEAEEQEEIPPDEAEEAVAEEAANVDDGGGVGEEENLPKDEVQLESQAAENEAPEEAAVEAMPEDGEEMAEEEIAGMDAADPQADDANQAGEENQEEEN